MTATISRYQFTAAQYERMRVIGIAPSSDGRFTADAYQQLAEAGILTAADRVELVHGEIITMSAMGRRHVRCIYQINQFFRRAIPDELYVGVQCAIRLDSGSEPEPDFAITREWQHTCTIPTAHDALFVIEVSDATLKDDREVKMPLYAAAGIAEAWLVDLKAGIVERYTEPRDGRYTQIVTGKSGDVIPSTTVPGLVIPVADVLR